MRIIDADMALSEMPKEIIDYAFWLKAQPLAIEGTVCESEYVCRRITSIKPKEHHYEETGEKPYIKYDCPICEALGNRHQVTPGQPNCTLCGVNLHWENVR